jgi:hypothetical protein
VQVLHVADESVIEEAREVAGHVDALLLDSAANIGTALNSFNAIQC